jgi:twitching motility protein PilT
MATQTQKRAASSTLEDLLIRTAELGASDLHLTVGTAPVVRLHGDLVRLEGHPDLDAEHADAIVDAVLNEHQRAAFDEDGAIDLAYAVPGVARFRVNVYRRREGVGAAFRLIPEKVRPLDVLGVPAQVAELGMLPRGLVLVTGPTGSGKSSTLAAVVDQVNRTRPCHILTIEDPIEYVHDHHVAVVNQREIGEDAPSFSAALRSALRQDPDVILVGELRDLETVATALTAAETGHLVLATLHTRSAPETVERMIDVFPPHQQHQVRSQLAGSLQGVVTQQLIKRADGTGRAVACEILIATPAVRNLIREGKAHMIASAMQGGGQQGMQTMDQALATLTKRGVITYRDGLERCSNQVEYQRLAGKA